jgi:hypothetical protein
MNEFPWFRMYGDTLDDPQVQRLPAPLFKQWINLLCLANASDPRGRLPENVSDIAYRLRLSLRKTEEILQELQNRGFLIADPDDPDSVRLMPSDWERRTKKSDYSAERVAEHRARGKNGNVTGPLQETVSVTDRKHPRGEEEEIREEREGEETGDDGSLCFLLRRERRGGPCD